MTKRLKLSILYLVTTLIILSLGIMLMKVFWYPYPLIQAAGANKIFTVVVVVNMVLTLTFVIILFRKSKNDFKVDIITSMMIQLLVFAASVYGLYQIKPVWIAYNVDRFELILNNDLVYSSFCKVDKQYEKPNYLSPKYVGVSFSQDNQEHTQNMFDEVFKSISLAQRPERYVPFTEVSEQVKKRAQSLKILEKYNDRNEVEALLEKYPNAHSFVPLQARALDMTVLLNTAKEQQVVAIVDLRPW